MCLPDNNNEDNFFFVLKDMWYTPRFDSSVLFCFFFLIYTPLSSFNVVIFLIHMLMEYGSINAFSQGLNICVNSAFSMKDDYFVMFKKKRNYPSFYCSVL